MTTLSQSEIEQAEKAVKEHQRDVDMGLEWEFVCSGENFEGVDSGEHMTDRLRVPGGWLYRTVVFGGHLPVKAVSMVFVPEV